eukprot:6411828-Pyramimonas_sp.AAC.1
MLGTIAPPPPADSPPASRAPAVKITHAQVEARRKLNNPSSCATIGARNHASDLRGLDLTRHPRTPTRNPPGDRAPQGRCRSPELHCT